MNENSLYIGLGGAGKTTFNKIMLDAMSEPQKPECLIIGSSDIKDTVSDSYNIHTEDKTNE